MNEVDILTLLRVECPNETLTLLGDSQSTSRTTVPVSVGGTVTEKDSYDSSDRPARTLPGPIPRSEDKTHTSYPVVAPIRPLPPLIET